jgi:hypothetical protein
MTMSPIQSREKFPCGRSANRLAFAACLPPSPPTPQALRRDLRLSIRRRNARRGGEGFDQGSDGGQTLRVIRVSMLETKY